MKYKKSSILLLSCLFWQSFSLAALSAPFGGNIHKAPQDTSIAVVTMNSQVYDSPRIKGLSGFSNTKFSYKQKAPRQNPSIAKQIEKAKLPSQQKQKQILDEERRITFAGISKEQEHDQAVTTRGELYGAKSSFDKKKVDKPTQVNVTYKNTEDTSTRVSINSQDKNSPLYSPLKKEEGLKAAGVYVETELSESTKALVGGEIRSSEALNNDSDNTLSQGVAVGLSWSF